MPDLKDRTLKEIAQKFNHVFREDCSTMEKQIGDLLCATFYLVTEECKYSDIDDEEEILLIYKVNP